jgi:hypothetical protein
VQQRRAEDVRRQDGKQSFPCGHDPITVSLYLRHLLSLSHAIELRHGNSASRWVPAQLRSPARVVGYASVLVTDQVPPAGLPEGPHGSQANHAPS